MPDTGVLDATGAVDLWHRLAPSNSRNLIDATDESTREEKRNRCRRQKRDPSDDLEQRERDRDFCALLLLSYFWDAAAVRYRLASGAAVSPQSVAQAVNTFAAKVENQLGAIGSRLADGSIGIPEWRAVMLQKVTAAHTAAHAIAVGGIDRVNTVESTVSYHTERLESFANDVQRGGMSAEAIVERSRLYGASVPNTFEAGQYGVYRRLSETGITVEMFNVLDDRAKHCRPTESLTSCIEETDKGWMPLGLMTRPGERACGPRCRCRLKYRQITD